MSIDLAVIGGTGLYRFGELQQAWEERPETPFGELSSPIVRGRWRGRDVAFLARHGAGHGLYPHQINYRANVWALAQLAPRQLVAINAVGSLDERFPPGSLAVPDQLIDYTWGREGTYFGELPDIPMHVDFTEPYDPALHASLLAAGGFEAASVVLGITQGPRLETAAEVRRMGQDGCHLVGMTGMPEAVLARELGLRYASLCVIANWAAGFGEQPEEEITMEMVVSTVEQGTGEALEILAVLSD
ncbi:MAG: S-methyl-5'-thioinosine phosphorylase [Xanthomonadales bacterium]|nr:S-methyl-5'-thioinosine phosphorylase [Xanthomonadales bacterium]